MPMKRYKKIFFSFLSAFLFYLPSSFAIPHINAVETGQKAKLAYTFCRQKGYNTRYCILIDMRLPSGIKRFMVWDFKKNIILISGLVSHGCGMNPWSGEWSKENPAFSNVDGSHCTALGKYIIKQRAYSAWGIHVKYYLEGLDSTNNNAFNRQIVFHSWEAVSENEVYPNGTPEGWGCPAIANQVMKVTDPLVKKQKKPMLLWIYNN